MRVPFKITTDTYLPPRYTHGPRTPSPRTHGNAVSPRQRPVFGEAMAGSAFEPLRPGLSGSLRAPQLPEGPESSLRLSEVWEAH